MIEFLTHPVTLGVAIWLVITTPMWALLWWNHRRCQADRRRWEVQRQVWDMERQIMDKQLPDEVRQSQRRARQRAAEVRREARRRLGLPDDPESPEGGR
jgi:hypothetical protein